MISPAKLYLAVLFKNKCHEGSSPESNNHRAVYAG
jgi:hypothetical protein